MFFLFNKEKIYSYIIASSTIVILFILSFLFINTDMKIVEVSSNIDNKIVQIPLNISDYKNLANKEILEKINEELGKRKYFFCI